MKSILFRALLSLTCLSAVPQVYAQADITFTVESNAFADNGVMDRRYADKNPANANCTDDDVSPPLRWSNVPTGTNSLVLIVSDLQGAGGPGVNHWMAYGIPATQTSLSEGADTGPILCMGQNSIGKPAYLGPCPPKGTGMHHYVFLLIAMDPASDALPNGLTRAELDAAIKGHNKGAAVWIGRFGNF